MEKRIVFFIVLSMAAVLGNALLSHMFAPPRVADQAAGPQVGGDGEPELGAAKGEVEPREGPGAEGAAEGPAAAEPAAAEEAAEPPPVAVAEKTEEGPEQLVSLGSVDPGPDNPYRMLVTLTNRGAAIVRSELASEQYRDIEDRSGYLGHLAPIDEPDGAGCRVRVVGAGTPAAAAGLRPGDVITACGDRAVHSAEDLREALSQTRPKREVRLAIQRDGQAMPPLTVGLMRRPLEVMRPERANLLMRKEDIPVNFQDPASLLLTLEQIDDRHIEEDADELAGIRLRDGSWELVDHDQNQAVFRYVLDAYQLEVRKTYRMKKVPADQATNDEFPGYHLEFDIEIRNLGEQTRNVAYRLDGPTGLPTEGWWYASKISRTWFGGAGLRDLVVRFEGGGAELHSCSSIAKGAVEPMGQGRSLMYIGVDAQYFASVLIPSKDSLTDVWFAESRAIRIGPEPDSKANVMLTNVTSRVISAPYSLDASGAVRHRFQVFVGPKKPELLAAYGQQQDELYNLKDLVYYGMFGIVAERLADLLHFFYSVVGNYGIGIVLLTVLVRGCMFPLSVKQARNMHKMQELAPEMKRISEKHKGDMEKRGKALQELYRKHNYNPMRGCLVMVFQLPIFIGLYRSLMVDVELRQAPLLGDAIRWGSNLSAPDMLWNWSSIMPEFITRGVGIFVLGPYFNVLPIITVGLFLWQQKMFMPPPTDDQTAMQQKMMKYMMVFIGIMFYKVASGLCLYFIASTLWGLAERKLLPKSPKKKDESAAQEKPAAPVVSANGNGSPGGKRRKKTKQKQKKR